MTKIKNRASEQVERLNSRIVELLRERDAMREALEKISGQREYHSKDHQMATKYKPEEGLWTTDEYLADAALAAVTSTDRTKP